MTVRLDDVRGAVGLGPTAAWVPCGDNVKVASAATAWRC